MGLKVCISDSIGNAHIAEMVPTDDVYGFKLVCTNSGEELARGDAWTDDGISVEIFSADPIFDTQAIELSLEAQINRKVAA